MKSKFSKKQIFILIGCGALIGLVNGFFGGGGGMLCVPILEKVMNLESKKAHATTLCVILPLCIVSAIIYILNNDIDFVNLSWVTLGAVCGGVLGAIFLSKINSKILRAIFAIIMLVAGIKMVI